MYSFPELIKKIREEAGLTQSQFAVAVGVSAILVAMIESGQKEVSKNFILKLAEALRVRPASITPFLYGESDIDPTRLSKIEKMFLRWGEHMQDDLIKNRARLLKKYAAK